MKLEIGETYNCESSEWTCVDILDDVSADVHERKTYGIGMNSTGIIPKSGVKIYVVVYLGESRLLIDWFYENEDEKGFLNSNETYRELREIHKPIESLPEKVREILAKTMKKDKRFISFESSQFSSRIVACVNESNVVCQYANEQLNPAWPKVWTIHTSTDLDITYEQYLKINGFKVKSKEEEIAELEAQVIDKLGCQKEHLTPVLKAFVELLKQIKTSKSTFKEISEIVMGRILKNENYIGEDQAEVKAIYNILKQIKEKI